MVNCMSWLQGRLLYGILFVIFGDDYQKIMDIFNMQENGSLYAYSGTL